MGLIQRKWVRLLRRYGVIAWLCVAWLCGCATSPANKRSQTELTRRRHEISRQTEHQRTRVRELENRLSLLESEAKKWRQDLEETQEVEWESLEQPAPGTRLVASVEGQHQNNGELFSGEVQQGSQQESTSDNADRPVLRLHELSEMDPVKESLSSEQALQMYRAGLTEFTKHNFDEASNFFQRVVDASGDGSYVERCLYWLGESKYAQKDFIKASALFIRVIELAEDDSIKPDALLKAGLSYARMGESRSATKYFEQLKTEFPRSKAARQLEKTVSIP